MEVASSIADGGSLKVAAGSVRLEKGFTVAKGGFLNIKGTAD